MKRFRRNLPNLILGIGVVCFATVSIMALAHSGVNLRWRQQGAKSNIKLPRITSKVKSLEVIGAAIEGAAEPNALVAIEIKNNSDKPIIALAVESGDGDEASGVSLNGFKGENESPAIVLKPHGTVKVRMPLSNLSPGSSIKIGGVIYADNTEAGDESTLGTLRRQKEHEKKTRKEGNSSQE